jgi:iron complex transport system ATP-binding protein
MTHVLLLKEGQMVAAGRKVEVLDELLLKTFQLAMKVHWENNRPWASIHKNIGSTKFAKVESK